MTVYSRAVSSRNPKATPVSRKIPGREADMTRNNAGGYVFKTGDMEQFKRFLILGSATGTYYQNAESLTDQNTDVILNLFRDKVKGPEAVAELQRVSVEGLAPKLSPTLYALALAFTGCRTTKRAAKHCFNTVVRTHSHLMEFVSYANELRGWGRTLREAVAEWYESKSADDLTYQLLKYRNRNSWTTADILRMAHPKPVTDDHNKLFGWAVGKKDEAVNKMMEYHLLAKEMPEIRTKLQIQQAVRYIQDGNLSREMIPNTWLNSKYVWEALLEKMPLTAMIRNLGKMTNVGLIAPYSEATKKVIARLKDVQYLKKSRIHPFNVLVAMDTYAKGRGVKGSLEWSPSQQVVNAMDKAFYASFDNIEPSGKNLLLALDVSGSMDWGTIAGTHITPMKAAATMALATAKVEENYHIVGFSHRLVDVPISPEMRLDTVIKTMEKIPMGGTNCALPMKEALSKRWNVDTFHVYTDDETWIPDIHPKVALDQYRNKVNPDARSAVIAFTSTGFSIADPKDPGMMDFVGFDSSAPKVLADFSAGRL